MGKKSSKKKGKRKFQSVVKTLERERGGLEPKTKKLEGEKKTKKFRHLVFEKETWGVRGSVEGRNRVVAGKLYCRKSKRRDPKGGIRKRQCLATREAKTWTKISGTDELADRCLREKRARRNKKGWYITSYKEKGGKTKEQGEEWDTSWVGKEEGRKQRKKDLAAPALTQIFGRGGGRRGKHGVGVQNLSKRAHWK